MEVKEAKNTRPLLDRTTKTSVIVFFIFMLLHQTDKLLIGPLQTDIMATFNMTYTEWGLINTGALIVGSVLYPLWGWLNDKYVGTAHTLFDLYKYLAVGESLDTGLAQWNSRCGADFFCQRSVGGSRNQAN